jgi:hypothetical protein
MAHKRGADVVDATDAVAVVIFREIDGGFGADVVGSRLSRLDLSIALMRLARQLKRMHYAGADDVVDELDVDGPVA